MGAPEVGSGHKPSQRALADVLEAIGDAVYAMDRDERILFANRRALELWGKTTAAVVGRKLLEAFPGIEDGEPYRAYQRVLATSEPLHLETMAPAMADRWIGLDVHPAPGGGLVVAFRDIDDRKRAEAALREANERLEDRVAARTAELEATNRRLADQIEEREKAEAKLRRAQRTEAIGQLTAGIAHDFNNLMTAIIGNIELVTARLGDVDERTARLLAAALAAAERGANLTTQLLAFSRQQRMAREWVDLNRVVAGIGPLIRSSIGGTIHIETAPATGLWPVLADAAQIELVLLNLAINARDATPAGGTITITTANAVLGPPSRPEEPPPGEYAMVAVADTGSGIAPDILDNVFDPFFTTKEVGRGSGLGLSQVLGVAQQLGGGVTIGVRPGGGTIVSVYVPRLREVLARAELPPAPRSAASQARHGVILLVDDDADVRTVAAAMLQEAGHIVLEAGDGSDALAQLEAAAERVDLLIADLAMPGMSGFDLAQIVRGNRPGLPILFVTGFADNAARLDSIDAHRLLLKPFRAAELTAKVAEALA